MSVQLCGKPASRLIQGTEFFKAWDQERALDLLDVAAALGCNVFDTAHDYGKGSCERILGTWLSRRKDRDRMIVITKCVHPWDANPRVTPANIRQDLAESLERLQLNCIDLFLLHRDDDTQPVEPLMETMHEAVANGRVRFIGASNWRHSRIAEANAFAKANGLTPFSYSSPHFSLATPSEPPWPGCIDICGDAGKSARDWHRKNQIPVLSWAAMALGFFSSDLATVSTSEQQVFASTDNLKRLNRLTQMACQKKVTVPQLALAYAVNQPFEVFPIVSGRTEQEIKTNLDALRIKLSPQECAWLETGMSTWSHTKFSESDVKQWSPPPFVSKPANSTQSHP